MFHLYTVLNDLHPHGHVTVVWNNGAKIPEDGQGHITHTHKVFHVTLYFSQTATVTCS